MMHSVAEWLYGGVYSDSYSTLDDGGAACRDQLTVTYRLASACFSLVFSGTLYWTLAHRRVCAVLSKSPTLVPPTALEHLAGLLLIVSWLSQLVYKSLAHRLIFMFSPCHQVSLLQLYLCFSPVTTRSRSVLLIMSAWLYGPILALLAPAPGLLSYPGEEFSFWYEHVVVAVVVPLALVVGGRYRDLFAEGWTGGLYGFLYFIVYQRVVLTAISLATWANISYALCTSETFPAYPYMGTYYLPFADFIVIPLSLIGVYAQKTASWLLLRKPNTR